MKKRTKPTLETKRAVVMEPHEKKVSIWRSSAGFLFIFFREIFSWVSKLIPECIGFALLRSVSGNMVTRKQEEMNWIKSVRWYRGG